MDIDIPFIIAFTVGGTTNFYTNLTVLAIITWQILFIAVPMLYIAIRLQVMTNSSLKTVLILKWYLLF